VVVVARILGVVLAFFGSRVHAAEPKPFEGFTKYEKYVVRYEVNADGTHVETHESTVKVLSDQGISRANRGSVSFSERLQDVQIVSAYTLKKGGRHVDVPASNFQEQTNTGNGDASPMFSDIKTKTVAFPDVAVGDSVVLSYRLVQKEALFPGQFSMMQAFSKFDVYDDAEVALDAPESLDVRIQARGVDGGRPTTKNGRRVWRWSYRNAKISKPEPAAVSSLDYGPIVIASTFADYGALAAAYDARARPKEAVTDRVRSLAKDVTKRAKTPRDEAKALYDWVSENVKFAGNCVGVGSVVPHEADLVLANRMGDCKDHAALLGALLAAKGIGSTPALIHTGSSYALPEVASAGYFNHVITYVPGLDLYADATARFTPFGLLPPHDAGKPVVHTADYTGPRRTPPTDYKENRAVSKTAIHVHPDGGADGDTTIDLTGTFAEGIKAMMDVLRPDLDDMLVRRIISSAGFTGTGTLSRPKSDGVADAVTYGGRYRLDNVINVPGPGAILVRSPFPGPGAIATLLEDPNAPDATVSFTCLGGSSVEEYAIDLPDGVRMQAVPADVEISDARRSYSAHYEVSGNRVRIVRRFEDRTSTNVCAPEEMADTKSFAGKVQKDLKAQLVYQ
jgi:transglutaminase-like putative cysteine protease